MIPVINSCGVTSNPGFIISTSGAQIILPLMCVTSSRERSSIIISSPVFIPVSIVESGAAI